MSRLSRPLLAVLAVASLAATVRAWTPATPSNSAILKRFLDAEDPALVPYRALRHLEARNDKFHKTAWMDAWTEVDRHGVFHYAVVAQGGSAFVRDRVMISALRTEQRMWVEQQSDRIAFTPANYDFEDRGPCGDGLVTLGVRARRRDAMLINGSVFVRPADGELVRVEGRLVKSPSFWTHHVEIVSWYRRIAGAPMPVATQSTANVFIAGRSTFRMTYEYETVNGQRVGSPTPRGR